MSKTSQLQIRVSPEQKKTLKRLADAAGLSVSSYVLEQIIPSTQLAFANIVRELRPGSGGQRGALAQMNALLGRVPAREVTHHLHAPELEDLSPLYQNYLAAMVEQLAHGKAIDPPSWVADVRPLDRPHFMWGLQSLRPHQVRVTPVAFKRRNIFFDPSGGPRV